MARLPFIILWITDFRSETAHLSFAECGAYMKLLTLCWQQPGCQLPDDEEWILRKLGASDAQESSAALNVLHEFFTKSGRYLRNDALRAQYEEALDKLAKRIKSGREGGQATARKRRDNLPSDPSISLEAKNEQVSSKPEPEPPLKREELSRPAFLEKLRRVIGPGANLAASYDPWPVIQEWSALGASEDLILRIVEKQTKRPRKKPIQSLRALESEIEAAIKSQPQAVERRVATPLHIPSGRAGDCLRAVIYKRGEGLASSWLGEAEWTDDEVIAPNDFYRSKVDFHFGAVLEQHGFRVTSRATN